MEYEDIIYLRAPKSKNHPPMARLNRAAQFAPFAALAGYHEAIEEEGRYVEARIEMPPEAREDLDRKMAQVLALPQDKRQVSLVFFRPDPKKEGGFYSRISTQVLGLDKAGLGLSSGQRLPLEDIIEIDCPYLDGLGWP